MKLSSSSEHDGREQEIIRLLKQLRAFEPEYPRELMAARRAAFLAQAEEQIAADVTEELSPADQEIVRLLGYLKTAPISYPPELMADRRAALLRQVGTAGPTSLWDRLRESIRRTFTPGPTLSPLRLPLVIAALLLAAWIGALLFSRLEPAGGPTASAGAVASAQLLPTGVYEVALAICKPDDQTPLCPPPGVDPGPDLADPENGAARPAVAKDSRSGGTGAHRAAYVNDGRRDASWVSASPDSWIKIDLGRVTTINTVSLQKGTINSSDDNNPGQFVIAVALSDVYSDGNSSHDYMEYARVFDSEQTGFSGRVSPAETIRTRFAPIQARFVKITFEQAGAAISEVGVFLEEPPVLAEQPTRRPRDDTPAATLTPLPTSTLLPPDTATPAPADTWTPTDPAVSAPSETSPPADTPTALPTTALPPDTATPLPTDPLPTDPPPSDTPLPSATAVPPTAVPPTRVPPTAIPPTLQPAPPDTGPIVVTGNEQTLTFTCNGNDAVIRGHANTVTLLGSCSSITVTGNGNRVFWESGSPSITNRGNDNIISQR